MKVRDLIKQLLDFEMDDDVVVEIESEHGVGSERSNITKVINDGYCVRIVPIDYLVDRDSTEWEIKKA